VVGWVQRMIPVEYVLVVLIFESVPCYWIDWKSKAQNNVIYPNSLLCLPHDLVLQAASEKNLKKQIYNHQHTLAADVL
jgi:hypothetical protein